MRSGRLAVGRVGCRKRGIQLVPGQKTRGADIRPCAINQTVRNKQQHQTRDNKRKTLNLLTLTVVTGSLLTLTARAAILGSPHDFSGYSWNNNPADPATVCSPCHTAHHADSSVIPLWSHASSVAPSFFMYNTANVTGLGDSVTSLQSEATISAQPAGPSMACLSCHDGVTAINAYGDVGRSGYGNSGPISLASAVIGTDLTHSHPISLTYSPAIVGTGAGQDKWLWNPNTANVILPNDPNFVQGNSMTINNFLLKGQNRLECTSCHDVHNQEGTPYNITSNPKLVKINGVDSSGVGSVLCRSCHNK